MIEVVEARLDHVIDLVKDLREQDQGLKDRIEEGFERIVIKEWQDSVLTWAGLDNGKCGALWGVKMPNILINEGMLWMLGGRFVDEHPITFLRHSKKQLEELRGTFRKLDGCVLSNYEKSQRWLEWLGFKIGEDEGGICRCEYRFV
jgi:hypothetical protein